MSLTTVVEVGKVTLVDITLRAGLGLMLWTGELWCLMAGRGCDELVGVFFCAEYC